MTTSAPVPWPDDPAKGPGSGIGPAVPPVPHGPAALARAALARAFLSRATARLPFRIQTPDGQLSGAGGPAAPVLEIRDQDAFYRRLGSGTAGLAEGYMTGAWDSDDLPALFAVFAEDVATLVPAPLQALRRWYIPREPAAEDATIEGARRNIERHYDLSDDLFALFLDPSMTYSSALFAPGDSLDRAQHRKIDTLLDRTGVGTGTSVLEIGTGWGELAVRAAARGARVTTLTISPSQWRAARSRAESASVADRVDVQLRDYREATGCYDVILSVEMIEAVDERHWPAYFYTLNRLLGPKGLAGLQAITMPHDRMLASRGGHTWIHKYIFPGGQIPSLQAITDAVRGHTNLHLTADFPMGQHYARTLAEWRSRYLAAADQVGQLGFSPAFQRMWELYLAYSEAGFRVGYLDVHQLILERGC